MEKNYSFPQVSVETGFRSLLLVWIKLLRYQARTYLLDWKRVLRNPFGAVGVLVIAVFAILALVHPLLLSTVWEDSVYDPIVGYDANVQSHPSTPIAGHLFGTDYLGRDVLSRVVFATRTSFLVGVVAAITGVVVATAIGLAAAYFGGRVDAILMLLADTFIMLPPAVVLLSVGLLLQMDAVTIGFLYGLLSGLGSLSITMKAHALSLIHKRHVEAARAMGSSAWRNLRVHILPNLSGLIVVNMMILVTGSVMVEAILSYLTARTQIPLSWGGMIWEIQDTFYGGAQGLQWHVLLPPALAIMLFCGSFYLVARTLDEVINPKLRQR